MRSLLKFVADTYTSSVPVSSPLTASDLPTNDYTIWLFIGLVYIACVVIVMAAFAVVTFCSRRRQNSANNSSTSPEPQEYFMVVELTPLVPSKRGLKKSALKALPKARYEKAADHDIENQAAECAVCLTEFEEAQWIRKLPQCGHEFHVKCIDKWLRSQPSCPSCRTEVVVHHPLSQEVR